MSFVDLMKNDVWSDADITTRTEAMVRAEFSVERELILNRKMQGAAAGVYPLSPEEQMEAQRFQQVCFLAQQEGVAARRDMALLSEALACEAAARRLAQEPVSDADEGYEQDLEERVQAEAVLAGAPAEVLELVAKRGGADHGDAER